MKQRGFNFRRKIVPERSEGFTIAEALVSLTVALVAGSLLISILVQNNGLFYQQTSRIEQGLGLNDALARIKVDIKESDAVSASFTDGPVIYTSGGGVLVLRIVSMDGTGSTIFNVYDYIIYFLEDGNLKLKVFPGAGSVKQAEDKILAFNVESANFEYFDNNGAVISPTLAKRVKVSLTVRQKAGYSFESSSLTTEARLRNQ